MLLLPTRWFILYTKQKLKKGLWCLKLILGKLMIKWIGIFLENDLVKFGFSWLIMKLIMSCV